jgi:hypothetical protein
MGDAGRDLQGSQLAVGEVDRKLDAVPLQGKLSALPRNERWQVCAARSPESSEPLPAAFRLGAAATLAMRTNGVARICRTLRGQVLIALLHGFGMSAEEEIRSTVLQF